MMEKRNLVEDKRTPQSEIEDPNSDWDKKAADEFNPDNKIQPVAAVGTEQK